MIYWEVTLSSPTTLLNIYEEAEYFLAKLDDNKNLMTCSASSPKAFSSRTPPRSSTNAFTFDNHSSTEINPKVEHLVPLPHLPHQENHWPAIGPNKKILLHPAFFNLEGNFEASSVGGFCFSVTRSYFSFMMQDNNADMGLLNQNF